MAGFEDLIRGALEKHGNPDAERRATIYQSSRNALEGMLAKNQAMDERTIAAQKAKLEDAIRKIEQGYTAPRPVSPAPPSPAAAIPPTQQPSAPVPQRPVAPPQPAPSPAPMPRPRADDAVAPAREGPVASPRAGGAPSVSAPAPQPRVHPAAPSVDAPPSVGAPLPHAGGRPDTERSLEDYTREYREEFSSRRRPYIKLLLWTIIIVGLAVAVWWAINFGPALLKRQIDGSVPNPSSPIESGSFIPGGGGGWLTAFLPNEDSANVDTQGQGTADLVSGTEGTVMRIASTAGDQSNTIRLRIPRGIMQAIRGKVATFELTMRAEDGEGHQFAVFCKFGPMGECGRKRFRIGEKTEAFIFDVLVNDASLPTSQDAHLEINSDLSGAGRPVFLLAARVRPGN